MSVWSDSEPPLTVHRRQTPWPTRQSGQETSRRDLLRGAFAVAAAAAGAPLISACSSAPDSSAVTATGSPSAPPAASTTGGAASGESPGRRALVAYFSRAGENYFYGGRTTLAVGNTQVLAGLIAARMTVDVYSIQAADPYPVDYDETVARNVREEQADARPAIAGALPSLDGYDTVLLGSPVWNSQEPMIMRTFIESFDWAGRTVQPFVTYAVSRMGRVRENYEQRCRGATVGEGLAVQGETVRNAGPEVQSWLSQIGLAT